MSCKQKKMTMTYERRRHNSTIAIAFLAAAVVGSLLLLAYTNNNDEPFFLKNNNIDPQRSSHRQLFSVEPFQFADPKSVIIRSNSPIEINRNSRNNCQIVYIMGVEGTTHHGFVLIIETLAQQSQRWEEARVDRVAEFSYRPRGR